MQSIFLLLSYTLWVIVAGTNCKAAFHLEVEGAECNTAHRSVQGSVLLQTSHSQDRRQGGETQVTHTLDRPHSDNHEVTKGFSFTSFWHSSPTLEDMRRSLLKLLFGTTTLTWSQKVHVGIMLGIAIVAVLIWGGLVCFSNRVLAAKQKEKERQDEEERWRSRHQWESDVDAYRNVKEGKNSRTVIRGSKIPQAQESAFLQAAIAQARARDGIVTSTPQDLQVAEEKARELRAQAAMARLSNPSKGESSSSTGAGNSETGSPSARTSTTEEEAERPGEMHSMDDDDPSTGGDDFDHLGPVACTYFRS